MNVHYRAYINAKFIQKNFPGHSGIFKAALIYEGVALARKRKREKETDTRERAHGKRKKKKNEKRNIK